MILAAVSISTRLTLTALPNIPTVYRDFSEYHFNYVTNQRISFENFADF